ncbi:hypothetical protein, partial [Xanthomonas euvesicatoria]|uniref:hypothetical protein n=1 Tax=Xanthomonas euvesicatoria TaxID=456327 RepID=UPI001F2DB204
LQARRLAAVCAAATGGTQGSLTTARIALQRCNALPPLGGSGVSGLSKKNGDHAAVNKGRVHPDVELNSLLRRW